LHQGRVADLTWTKPAADRSTERLVLRAWKIDAMIGKAEKTYPIFLMSLTRERLRRGFNLYSVPSPLLAEPQEREELASLIRSIPTVRIVAAKGLDAKDGLTLVDAIQE
jgi:hypothetical protein